MSAEEVRTTNMKALMGCFLSAPDGMVRVTRRPCPDRSVLTAWLEMEVDAFRVPWGAPVPDPQLRPDGR